MHCFPPHVFEHHHGCNGSKENKNSFFHQSCEMRCPLFVAEIETILCNRSCSWTFLFLVHRIGEAWSRTRNSGELWGIQGRSFQAEVLGILCGIFQEWWQYWREVTLPAKDTAIVMFPHIDIPLPDSFQLAPYKANHLDTLRDHKLSIHSIFQKY